MPIGRLRRRGRPRVRIHTVIKEYVLKKEVCERHGNHMVARYVYVTGRVPERAVICRLCEREAGNPIITIGGGEA